jgi:hypothetical protein
MRRKENKSSTSRILNMMYKNAGMRTLIPHLTGGANHV